ncbi:MAG: universal stress protein [Proteobacteria bacterium]|nr:universal stress protein [Pseudomonadota bacterium]
MPYKNILVAVDESQSSQLALQEAIKFSRILPKCLLRILHVGNEFFIDFDGKAIYPKDTKEVFKDAQLALLKNIEIELREAHISNFETRLVEENPQVKIAQQIVEEAKSWPADLIILGTHGRKGLQHLIVGSVAEGVIRLATMPVLLIRAE